LYFLNIKQKNLSSYSYKNRYRYASIGFWKYHHWVDCCATRKWHTHKSILSHLATSDDLEHMDFANTQIALFEKLSSKLLLELQIKPLRHILNTSELAIWKRNMIWFDWELIVRCVKWCRRTKTTRKCRYLKSIISQIRTISAGESVGYVDL
jgi:alanine racemase